MWVLERTYIIGSQKKRTLYCYVKSISILTFYSLDVFACNTLEVQNCTFISIPNNSYALKKIFSFHVAIKNNQLIYSLSNVQKW